ncbi:hypothetical protein [Frankia sp. CiP3]|uniref:methylation-associated defense system ATP-binding protein MAD8 n=1 Tax=Frankia sp. CiP3 TaxID=2880971 RepID=UPI001EF4A96B|nr:hypothetical protein [Frankia sp. CiP3]
MTTTSGLREITDANVDQALERVLLPRLSELLSTRGNGHCMRINDVDGQLSATLTRRLRGIHGDAAQIHVLGEPPQVPPDVAVTATKLVELRNPDADGSLRPVLLVFVPPGSQTSAEDSFGVATFEELALSDSYSDLSNWLLAALPADLHHAVGELFEVVDAEAGPDGPTGDGEIARARFLLTLALNDNDREAAGAALFELGLVPDFELFTNLSQVRTQSTRNLRQVQILDRADRSVRQRVIDLRLRDQAFRKQLSELLVRVGLDDVRTWTRRIVAEPANWPLSFHRWPLPDDAPASAVELVMGDPDLPRAGDSSEHHQHPLLGSIIGQPYLVAGGTGPTQLAAPFEVPIDPRKVEGLARFTVQLISEDSGPTGVRGTVAVSTTARRAYKVTLKKLRSANLDPGWHFLRVLPLDKENTPLAVAGVEAEETGDNAVKKINESERFFVVTDDDLDEHTPPPKTRRGTGITQELRQLELAAAANGRDWSGVKLADVLWRDDQAGNGPDKTHNAQTRSRTRPGTTAGSGLRASFGPLGLVDIPLSATLVEIEQAIIADPDRLSPWLLHTTSGLPGRHLLGPSLADHPVSRAAQTSGDGQRTPSDSAEAAADGASHGPVEEGRRGRTTDGVTEAFREARTQVFAAIRGDDNMIVEGRDVLTLRAEILVYAEEYAGMLNQQLLQAERADDRHGALRALATLLQIDAVVVEHQEAGAEPAEITLVAPTHPLRLLWLLTWAELGRSWSAAASAEGDRTVARPLYESLAGLRPAGFPLAVPGNDGRLSMAASDFGSYWQVCLPTETQDPRALLAEIAASLAIPDFDQGARDPDGGPDNGSLSTVPATRLADCVERYARLHPYLETLVVCLVNPGRGERLADMLLDLERRPATRHLSYDVRLFATDPGAPGTGEALADLLAGRWGTTREAEAFHTPTLGRSVPKLAVALRPLAEFRSATSRHAAHLTFLFDAFSGESLSVGPDGVDTPAPIHGLIQAIEVGYVDNGEEISWHRQPRHGRADGLSGAEELSDLLTSLPKLVSQAAAAVSTGEVGTGQVPRATLTLTIADQELLHQAHRCSDWVVTVDRALGIEYFDNPGSRRRPDYVIDDGSTSRVGTGHQLVISSRSIDELHALLAPMIGQHGFEVDRRHAGTFFDQLRLLSGRLAFKIASTAPNQRTEVLGLALARLYLDYQGALDDQILVPLDSHLELYREARLRADEVATSVKLERTDLALFSLNARERTVVCRLVEVKCRSDLSRVVDLQRVRDDAAKQLDRSAMVLADRFDPKLRSPDRADRVVHNLQIAALLRFYLGRAIRHEIMRSDAAAEAGWLLDHLDQGYRWETTRAVLIFDLSGQGAQLDVEGGIEFHTLGRDVAEELLRALPTDPQLAIRRSTATRDTRDGNTPGASADLTPAAPPSGTGSAAARAEEPSDGRQAGGTANTVPAKPERSVPRLAQASFLEPHRSHEIPSVRPDNDIRSDSDTVLSDGSAAGDSTVAREFPAGTSESEQAVDHITSPPEPSVVIAVAGDDLLVKPAEPHGEGQPVPRTVELPADSGSIGSAEAEATPSSAPSSTASTASLADNADGVPGQEPSKRRGATRAPDVYLGSSGPTPQYGVLGESLGRRIALDLNETHTISLFGVQGGGKSYTLGSVIEAASLPAPPVNQLPRPLATIVFHYSPTSDYAPEFTSMTAPNSVSDQVRALRERYGAEPAALRDVLMLVPESQIDQRRAEYPDIEVRALAFSSAELQARHWRFLMGAIGNQSTYIRQLNRIMRAVRSSLTLEAIRDGIDASSLTDSIKQLAHQRLDIASDYIDDSVRVGDLVRPGRMIIVDLRDDLIEKDEALGLFVVLMELFAAASGDEQFNKLVVFDEAHKYIESPDLVASLVESVREMRHKGMSILVASQDPPSVALALIELSDIMILHRFNSPGWLKHLQKANTALADLTSSKLNALTPGEAYVWAGRATDDAFTRGAIKTTLRPRLTRHGGATKTAVE